MNPIALVALLDQVTGNFGFSIAAFGLVLWIVGSVAPDTAGFKFSAVAPIGKAVFWVGIAIFILLLII